MKIKLHRMISIATLVASVTAVFLVLKKPAPVAQPQASTAIAANAQSFDQKLSQLEQASQQSKTSSAGYSQVAPSEPGQVEKPSAGSSKTEVRLNSDEVGAAIAQSLGTATTGAAGLSANTDLGGGAPTIKDQQVSFDGDVVHGQFLTEIAGKDVWVTVSGHLASKDGYATFEPTEFKVGDLNVPVSLVNPALQKKLAEQRDRMKLPDFVGDVKVNNSELVMTQK